jgi:hypothetical protein
MKSRILRRVLLAVSAAVLFAGSSPAQIYLEKQTGGVGITVFRDENFRGQNATFRQDVPDLRRSGFNDRITSLRVAPGEYWEACERANYQGRCQVFSGDERDLRNVGWTDRISSLRRVRRGGSGGGVGGKFGIVLYDDPYFRGRSVTIKDPVENLRFVNFHDRAESVRVLGGSWEICSEPRFRRCQTVDRDVAQLSSLGMNKKLSSARPASFDSGGDDYPPPSTQEARLVLFEGEGYRGRSVILDRGSDDLVGIAGRARSLQVISGSWLVCDGPRFTGRCREISESIPDLDRWGSGARILSARPVDRYWR